MKRRKKETAITLVSLVITIIILLILAGISISSLTNTGTFGKAQEAKSKMENAEKNQEVVLSEYEKTLNEKLAEKLSSEKINKVLSMDKNVSLIDENGNMLVVPAGFKIVVDDTTKNAITVDKGIVVEDATVKEDGTPTSTNGSQFVWIPVGNIKKDDGEIVVINLNRYTFESDGTPVELDDKEINNYVELKKSNYGNKTAKDIDAFKASVIKNGGYYIGRYEARRSSEGEVTENGNDVIFGSILQPEAVIKSQNMYNNSNFVTDLFNSYSWDTAIVFLQNFGTNKEYFKQISINKSYVEKGTNSLSNESEVDLQCNIYDMASNLLEWTTETHRGISAGLTTRGGLVDSDYHYLALRNAVTNGMFGENVGFRPILYMND